MTIATVHSNVFAEIVQPHEGAIAAQVTNRKGETVQIEALPDGTFRIEIPMTVQFLLVATK